MPPFTLPIFDPLEHEPLTEAPWDTSHARDFVRRIVEDTDRAYDPQTWWPLHPEDAYGGERGPNRGLYCGAAGTMWGLHRLSKTANIGLRNDYAAGIRGLEAAYRRDPWETGEVVPGYFLGTTGMLAARFAITGDSLYDELEREVRANVGNVTREAFWGSSGSALAAILIREATGSDRFDGVLSDVQREYWESWPRDGECPLLWLQEMYGKQQRYVGAGHGAFGNLAPFIRASDLLSPATRRVLHERIVSLHETYALQGGDAENWISAAQPAAGNRLQWCHGAPGIIMALASYPANDERIETPLRRGGQAIWEAGPLKKGPAFCHGTSGNGYALLRLYERTGEQLWLERAQRFAVHAMQQVQQWREQFGMPSSSLWTGEIGAALFVDGVLRTDPAALAVDAL